MSDQAAATGGNAPATASNFRSAMMSGGLPDPVQSAAPVPPSPDAQNTGDDAQSRWAGDLPPSSDEPPMALDDDQAAMEDALGQQEPPPGAELDENNQPVADPLDADVHGVKAREVLEALGKGVFPEALADKVLFEVNPNGQKRMVNAAELKSGYMRQVDYTRGTEKLAAARREAAQFERGWTDTLESWKGDPESLRRGMRRFGLGDALFKAARAIAAEEYELQQMTPEQAAVVRENRRLKEERDELEERTRAAEQTKEQRRRAAMQEKRSRILQELSPVAFQRANLPENEVSRQHYIQHLRVLMRAENANEPTIDLCTRAATAAAESLADIARRWGEATVPRQPAANDNGRAAVAVRPQQPQQGLPARRAAPGPATGPNGQPAQRQGGMKPAEAAAYLRSLGSRV